MNWQSVDQTVRGLWHIGFYVKLDNEDKPVIVSTTHYGDQHSIVHVEQNLVRDMTNPHITFIGVSILDPMGRKLEWEYTDGRRQ